MGAVDTIGEFGDSVWDVWIQRGGGGRQFGSLETSCRRQMASVSSHNDGTQVLDVEGRLGCSNEGWFQSANGWLSSVIEGLTDVNAGWF